MSGFGTCGEVAAPGNLIAGPFGLYAFSGVRKLVELSDGGRVLRAIDLPLPVGEAATRGAISGDGSGLRAVFWTAMGANVVGAREDFSEAWVFPRDDTVLGGDSQPASTSVRDVALADLDGDGESEAYVALAGDGGVHRVNADGVRRWTNRACPSPLTITTEAGGDSLLVVGQTGQAYPLTSAGDDLAPRNPFGRGLIELRRESRSSQPAPGYCGVTLDALGRSVALGLDRDLNEHWNYDLPVGVFATQLQAMVSGRLWPDDAGHWLFAGPDGSIHLVGRDGRSHDYFRTGGPIHGLAIWEQPGEHSLLVVAGSKAITAWRLTP